MIYKAYATSSKLISHWSQENMYRKCDIGRILINIAFVIENARYILPLHFLCPGF